MNIKYLFGTVLLCTFALLSACSTTPVCIAPSTTPLDKRSVIEYDRVEGSDSAFSILGLWMIGQPDIDAAISDALSGTEGTALTEVRCYEDYYYFILFSVKTVRVSGKAVRVN